MEIINEEKAAALIGISVKELQTLRDNGLGPKFLPLPRGVMARRMMQRSGKERSPDYSAEDVKAWIAERDANLTA